MAKHRGKWRSQFFSLANNMVAAILFGGIAMIATIFYSRFGTAWSAPVFQGLIAFFIVISIFTMIRLFLALPLARERITTENIEARLLEWLYKFRLTVKNSPTPNAHFHVEVTTDSDRHILIGRSKDDWSDYLEFWAGLRAADENEQVVIDSLTKDQASWITVNLKLELARARVGYAGLTMLGSEYRISKRIPITEALTEDQVINTIWEMEAILSILYYRVVKDIHLAKHGKLFEVGE